MTDDPVPERCFAFNQDEINGHGCPARQAGVPTASAPTQLYDECVRYRVANRPGDVPSPSIVNEDTAQEAWLETITELQQRTDKTLSDHRHLERALTVARELGWMEALED